jgi:sugar phosphate isomerase/epimerase
VKLGISHYCYYRAWKSGSLDAAAFVRLAKKLGVDGVELLAPMWNDFASEASAVEDALQETGLKVGVYSVSNNFGNADAAVRDEHLHRITAGVDAAVRFGAKVVRVFAGDTSDGVTLEKAFDWIVEGLSRGAHYASESGITLALENHGKLAGRSDQVLRILEAVGNPALKANPDMGNFLLVHQAPHEAVNALASHAAMAHLKDFTEVPPDYSGMAFVSLDGLKYRGVAVGDGEVAIQDCVQELKDAGFNGWVNIEYEGDEDPHLAMPRGIGYARQVLQEVEQGKDI